MKDRCERQYRPKKGAELLRCEKRPNHQGLHKANGLFWRDGQSNG